MPKLSDSSPTERERWLGPYRLLQELGRGANGVVYLAEREGRRVAVKVLLPTGVDDPEAVVRFQLEADVARKLDDPGVVRVFDAGREGNHYYYVMEHCPGPTLSEALAKHGRFEREKACKLLARLARTVAYAHEQGVLHRDLKPANVILDSTKAGIPRITDFGLARDRSLLRSLTETGTIMGTPLYMSPEQLRGDKDLDGRADAYSLGVMLYRCLTGELPHVADSRLELTHKVLHEDAQPPSRVVPDLPPWLDEVCLRALVKDREGRSTAAELAEDLEAGGRLSDRPRRTSSRRAVRTASPRRKAPARKNPALLISGALMLVGVAAAAGIVLSQGRGSSGAAPASSSAPQQPGLDAAQVEARLQETERLARAREAETWNDQAAALSDQVGSGDQAEHVRQALAAQAQLLFDGCATELHRPVPYEARLEASLRAGAERLLEPAGRARAQWELADYLRRRGRYRQALTSLVPILGDADYGARARQTRAHLEYKLEGMEGAWDAWREAWLQDREGAAGLCALADRALCAEDPEGALRYAEASLRVDADYPLARALRAMALVSLGRQVAQAELIPKGSDDPDLLLAAYVSSGDAGQLAQAYQLTDGQDSVIVRWRGMRYYQAEDYDRAVEALGRSAELRPDATALLYRGLAHLRLEKQAEAEEDFRRANQEDPYGFPDALETTVMGPAADQIRNLVGISRTSSWDLRNPVPPAPEGYARLERVVASVSEPARKPLRQALLDVGEGLLAWPQVQHDLDRAQSAAPQDPRLALELARVYLGRDLSRQALEQLSRARELGATPAPLLDLLEAEAHLRGGHQAEALRRYQQLSQREATSAYGFCAAAEQHLIHEEWPEAAKAAEAALRLEPNMRPALAAASRALLDSDSTRSKELAFTGTQLYGSQDSRLLFTRSAADGQPYVKPAGMMMMMQSENHMKAFMRARRYAQAGCWTSQGAYTCVMLTRESLRAFSSDAMHSAMALAGGRGLGMMSYWVVSIDALCQVGLQREPDCAELWQAKGALLGGRPEQDAAWQRARSLDPALPLREVYKVTSQRVAEWFPPESR